MTPLGIRHEISHLIYAPRRDSKYVNVSPVTFSACDPEIIFLNSSTTQPKHPYSDILSSLCIFPAEPNTVPRHSAKPVPAVSKKIVPRHSATMVPPG